MDMTDQERKEQDERLYCNSPPESQKELVNIPSKDRDYSYMKPKSSAFICECGKDWKFWVGISFTGLMALLIIGNWEYGFFDPDFEITFEVPLWFVVGEVYFIIGACYVFPLVAVGFGVVGLRSYCNPRSIWNKDFLCLFGSLFLLLIGAILVYLIYFSEDNFVDLMYRMLDGILENEKNL